MWWLLVVIWVLCGIETYGRLFAYFQREYAVIADENYKSDIIFCAIISLTGPIAFIVSFIVKHRGYGYKFR